jgi:hypothetical protein
MIESNKNNFKLKIDLPQKPINWNYEQHSVLPTYEPQNYDNTNKPKLEYGTYLVVRKDGKKHFETWNSIQWAYNDNAIVAYYLPKIN